MQTIAELHFLYISQPHYRHPKERSVRSLQDCVYYGICCNITLVNLAIINFDLLLTHN